jgi:DNA polymerase elongation subunit (family B)
LVLKYNTTAKSKMPISFHILDVFARDKKVVDETENEVVVEYSTDSEQSDDDEFIKSKNKPIPKKNSQDHSGKSIVVHLFGKTVEGHNIRADLTGFKPFFFIRCPEGDSKVQNRAVIAVREYIKRHITSPIKLIEITKCQRRELFGFTQNRSVPMLKLTMPSLALFREVKNCFCNSAWEFELKKMYGRSDCLGDPFPVGAPTVYEANLDPMLRLLHLRNLKPCNWATIETAIPEDLTADTTNIIECDWESIIPCDTPPAPTAPFKIASWDIECMSTTGAFPMATKGDPIIQIGVILSKLGSTETPEKYIFVLGSCDEIPEGKVYAYKDERKLLLGWFQWLSEQDIDIFIGYNIFGFDEKYVWERCQQLGITAHNQIQELNRLSEEGSEMKLEEKRLSSSAMGDNFLYLWTITGRLHIDLYHYIKREYPLPSYKLDDTSRNFLGESVKSICQKVDGWELVIHTTTNQDVAKGRSVVLLNAGGDTLCDKLDVLEYEPGRLIVSLPDDVIADEVAKWAIVKDDLSPKEMFKLHQQGSADRAIIARYCVQDCQLVLDLFKKLEVFNKSMSMANVCSVPISYIFLRGQGIKIESLMFKYCYESEQCIAVLPVWRGDNETYEGAIVLDPTPGFYTSPVGVADFASLYPSTIISENISHDTLVWVKDFDENGNQIPVRNQFGDIIRWNQWGDDKYDNIHGQRYTDIEYDNIIDDPNDMRKMKTKIKAGTRVCRYAQDQIGTIPKIVAGLLAARKAKRKEGEKESDPFRKALLDSEQLAYKLTANSLYGQLGSGTFKVRLRPLAASVTAYGRKQIMFAKAAIEMRYGPNSGNPSCCASAETVYGDSVTGDTPLIIRSCGEFSMITIADLFNYYLSHNYNYGIYHNTKEAIELNNTEIWTERGWTNIKLVIRHKLSPNKKLFRISTQSGEVDVTEDHSLVLANGVEAKPKDVMIGTELLHSIPEIYNGATINIVSKGDKITRYSSMRMQPNIQLHGNEIISIEELPHPGNDYVYDLETENHHFAVGPGNLIVHNTDSLFINFNPKDPETGKALEGHEAVKRTIELTEEAGKYVTQALKAPHDFEFDKVYYPFIIFSKKRYVGYKYESADSHVLWFMGVALKRRDYAAIVKRIYSGALNILLNERDVAKAANFVQQSAVDLVEGKFGLQPLVISKSLRAEYADPTRIPHKVLADRIAKRDPGNAPSSGDRIPYIYIQAATGQVAPDLQGDRIETPAYIREKGLKPDYMYYIDHQIANPVCQLFGAVVDQIPGYEDYMPKGGWKTEPELLITQREAAAYQLLFGEAMSRNTQGAKRAFAKMLGATVATEEPVKKPVRNTSSSSLTKEPAKRQSTLDSLFADTMKMNAMKIATKKKSPKSEKK